MIGALHVQLCDGCADKLLPLLELPTGAVDEMVLLEQVARELEACPACSATAAGAVRAAIARARQTQKIQDSFRRGVARAHLRPSPMPPQRPWKRTRTI